MQLYVTPPRRVLSACLLRAPWPAVRRRPAAAPAAARHAARVRPLRHTHHARRLQLRACRRPARRCRGAAIAGAATQGRRTAAQPRRRRAHVPGGLGPFAGDGAWGRGRRQRDRPKCMGILHCYPSWRPPQRSHHHGGGPSSPSETRPGPNFPAAPALAHISPPPPALVHTSLPPPPLPRHAPRPVNLRR
jgi:hypothetical protein